MQEQKAAFFLRRELEKLKEVRQRTNELKTSMYERRIVFQKYWGFARISSIYEYICSGRAATLGEAYNILELEIRLDRILTNLDMIIVHLEEIKQTQYLIYDAVTKANERLGQIAESNDQIVADVKRLGEQGAEFIRKVEGLQALSAFSLYFDALRDQQSECAKRWLS